MFEVETLWFGQGAAVEKEMPRFWNKGGNVFPRGAILHWPKGWCNSQQNLGSWITGLKWSEIGLFLLKNAWDGGLEWFHPCFFTQQDGHIFLCSSMGSPGIFWSLDLL